MVNILKLRPVMAQARGTDRQADGTGRLYREGKRGMDHVKVKKRQLVHQGTIVDIYKDVVVLPSGGIETWDYVEHRTGASVSKRQTTSRHAKHGYKARNIRLLPIIRPAR